MSSVDFLRVFFFFLLALTFQNIEQFLPFLSLTAFGSCILPTCFHVPYPALPEETYSSQHVTFSLYFYCISSSHLVIVRLLVSKCSISHLSVFTWIRSGWSIRFLKILICCIPRDFLFPFCPCRLKHYMFANTIFSEEHTSSYIKKKQKPLFTLRKWSMGNKFSSKLLCFGDSLIAFPII